MAVAIFDLDGCLSDDRVRRSLLPGAHSARRGELTQRDFEAYHESMRLDEPINKSVLADAFARGRLIVFCTARPERYRDETTTWLNRNFKQVMEDGSWTLLMRPEGDFRRSPELKVALISHWLLRNGRNWSDIAEAYDDREDVLNVYAQAGARAVYVLDIVGLRRLTNTKSRRPSAGRSDPTPGDVTAAPGAQEFIALYTPSRDANRNDPDFPLLDDGAQLINTEAANDVPVSVPEILEGMAATFRERNNAYGENYRTVAPVMKLLFRGKGLDPAMVLTDQWHLFELLIVKLTRFANSELTHKDSIHDAAVYAAMIEACLENEDE